MRAMSCKLHELLTEVLKAFEQSHGESLPFRKRTLIPHSITVDSPGGLTSEPVTRAFELF